MEAFQNKDGKSIVMHMIRVIQESKNYLSEIDGAIGDGDHGINMNKGFTLCEAKLKDKEAGFSESLIELGDILFNEIGGSMGPIYGLFFTEMGMFLEGRIGIDAKAFYGMLSAGLEALRDIVTADIGDKTLMDALIPAHKAFGECLDNDGSFEAALRDMKAAANTGRDATKDMVARLGRASRLGERSRGVIDAGAASCSLILSAMADSITELLKA
jgi:dihydroxyacetone kinase-like protein